MKMACSATAGLLSELGLSVQMKLYNMHKREFVMVFIIFFAAFSLSIFIGLAGPPITRTTEQRASQIVPNESSINFSTGPFVLRSPALSIYYQQLWIIGRFLIKKKDQLFQKEFSLLISFQGVSGNEDGRRIVNINNNPTRYRKLTCEGQTCSEFLVLHLGYIEFTHYIFNVSFKGLEAVHNWSPIEDVIFYLKTYNPSFTQLEIWLRFIFVLSTFCVSFWFAHSLRKYSINDWSLEQKWMSALLPLAVLYNNPFFPLVFLVDSWIPAFIDTLFQFSFLFAMLLFWLCVYHGLRQNNRSLEYFYLPKIAIVGWMWLCSVVTATAEKVAELRDPLFSASMESNNFQVFKILFYIGMALYIFYLLFLMVSAYSELRSMPFFDIRLKFLTLLMTFTVVILVVVTAMRFGVGALEDNFVSQLSTKYSSSAEFTAFYGLFNLYVTTCAYVYSPSKRSFIDSHVLKDNPAISMVNDSDEDVIYGSDDETRRPLNRGGNENEESD